MKAIYNPEQNVEAEESAQITIGLGELSDETFTLIENESPKDVPPNFELAVQNHPDINIV